MNHFKFFPNDFLEGVAFMDNYEVGVYIKLLCKQWTDKKIEKENVHFIAGMDWEDLPKILTDKFIDFGDYVINKRLEKERTKEPDLPCQEVVDLFNENCVDLPKVKVLSRKRKSAINARVKDYKPDDVIVFFESVFNTVNQSDFLTGKNKEGWTADFDWILNPNNFIKIIEGKYSQRKLTSQEKQIDMAKRNLSGWG
jgi:hypothetical protein